MLRNRLTTFGLFLAILSTGAVAASTLQASEGSGCCGRAESAQICVLESSLMECDVNQGGSAQCYGANPEFPHCCPADGYCSPVMD